MVRISLWAAVFLVFLRVAIGWHFAAEGWNKIRGTYIGKTETNKPFTSEGYFREAEGPLGPIMRKQLGDPDEELLALLNFKPPVDVTDFKNDPGVVSLVSPTLEAEWKEYLDRFISYYKLDEAAQQQARDKFELAKRDLVNWYYLGEKDVKKKVAGSSSEIDVREKTTARVTQYKELLKQLRDIYENKLPAFGKDVEKTRLRNLKADIAALRADLTKDLDAHFTKLKDALGSGIKLPSSFSDKIPEIDESRKAYEEWKDLLAERKKLGNQSRPELDKKILDMEAKVASLNSRVISSLSNTLALVTPKEGQIPEKILKNWESYSQFILNYGDALESKPSEDKIAQQLENAKTRYVRWLAGQLEYGEPNILDPSSTLAQQREEFQTKLNRLKALYQENLEAVKSNNTKLINELEAEKYYLEGDLKFLNNNLIGELNRHLEGFKNSLGINLGDLAKGYAPPAKEKTTNLEWMDRITRWGLFVVGLTLMFGLFTRLSCFGAAFFLLNTYLNTPAFPWLPVSPMSEGNYVYVNKNVIEMLALVALMFTNSGKWFGLDGLVSWCWTTLFRKRQPKNII